MSTLTSLRADVRRDLRDVEAGAYKWSDEELDRHITRALADYTRVAPLVGAVVRAAEESATYDLGAVAGWLWCEMVESPLDQTPRARLSFEELTPGAVHLLEPALPPVGQDVRFWYAGQHTLDAATCTVPYEDESTLTLGAVAYALLAYADHSIGRANASWWDPRGYRELGLARLGQFRAELERLRAARGWALGLVGWG